MPVTTPVLRVTQGATVGSPDVGFEGVIGQEITLDVISGGGTLSHTWLLLDVPRTTPQSVRSIGQASLTGASTAQAKFTPDVPGTYRFSYQGDNTSVAYILFAANNVKGFRSPAAHSKKAEVSFEGNTRGHAYEMDKVFDAVLATALVADEATADVAVAAAAAADAQIDADQALLNAATAQTTANQAVTAAAAAQADADTAQTAAAAAQADADAAATAAAAAQTDADAAQTAATAADANANTRALKSFQVIVDPESDEIEIGSDGETYGLGPVELGGNGESALYLKVTAEEATNIEHDIWALSFINTAGSGKKQHTSHGPFWPSGSDLGAFRWECFAMFDDTGGYAILDGYGGNHRVLLGASATGGILKLNGNCLFVVSAVNTPVAFGSDEALKANAWYHIMVWFDGTSIRAYLNGVLVHKVTKPTGGTAQSPPFAGQGGGWLYLGNNDHAGMTGRIGQVRGFEGANTPALNLDDYAQAIPRCMEAAFYDPNIDATVYPANAFFDFSNPSGLIVPDYGIGYNGRTHPGRRRDAIYAVYSEPSGPSPPEFVRDSTAPYGAPGLALPPDNSRAPAAPAGDDLAFHDFAQRDKVFAWGELGGIDNLQYPAIGAAFQQHRAGSGADTDPNLFGVLDHWLVWLKRGAAVQGVAYWDIPGLTSGHVSAERKVGTWLTGQQYTGVAGQITDRGNFYLAFYHAWFLGTGCYLLYYRNGVLNYVGGSAIYTPSPSNFTRLGLSINNATGRIKLTTDGNVIADQAVPADPPPATGIGWGFYSTTDNANKSTSGYRARLWRVKAAI